jgi:Transposase DDE domain
MSHSTSLVPFRTASAIHQLAVQPGLPFAHYLPARTIQATCRAAGHLFRERLYGPAVTLWMFLGQLLDPNHCCRQAVARFLAFRSALGLSPCSADTGGYCKARQRLPEKTLIKLTRATGSALRTRASATWRWKGREVKIPDGTCLSMPDTRENRQAFPPAEGSIFPVLRLLVVFNLAVGTVLDAALSPFSGEGHHELPLLRSLRGIFKAGDVWLADRLYCSYWVVAQALAAGADVVVPLTAARRRAWRSARRGGKGSRRTCWFKPARPTWMTEAEYHAIRCRLHLRMLRVEVRRRGFRTRQLMLVTTLTDETTYPTADLADLYRRRWQAELDLRSLKVVLQMDVLRGKSPEMVRKEVWGHLLAYNLVRSVMVEAALRAGVRPDQLSFAGAWETIHAFLPHLRMAISAEQWAELWQRMLQAIGRHRVGQRPNRYEPRAKKRRPKRYPFLHCSRAEARRRIHEGENPEPTKS